MTREEALAAGLIKIAKQPIPDLFWKECGRKEGHEEWFSAFLHALSLATDNPIPNKKLSVYRCKWGPHWHVGHKAVVDWNLWVPKSEHTTVQNKLIAVEAELTKFKTKYDKKCEEIAAERRSYVPRLITPAKPIKEPVQPQPPKPTPKPTGINKLLNRFGFRLERT